MKPRMMAHGGAWDWDDALDFGKHQGLKIAIRAGQNILDNGGSALDAVEKTVIALEDNPVFDAGTGGHLNEDGIVQLDALIVDGSRHDFGAVAGVTSVKNPVALARKILEETNQVFFVGHGANQQAGKLGISPVANETLVTPEMREYFYDRRTDGPSDTVGAIAIDKDGNVAAAASTSGSPYKPAGRVGDAPFYGAGGYAENYIGAAGATGHGEMIARTLLSKHACDQISNGACAMHAAQKSIEYFELLNGKSMSALIVIDKDGNLGASQTAPKMAFGWVDLNGNIHTAMTSSELRK
ncbi:MAG: isoaspartyl peptidase/L-asparaginase [Pseudomonadota bacterium]